MNTVTELLYGRCVDLLLYICVAAGHACFFLVPLQEPSSSQELCDVRRGHIRAHRLSRRSATRAMKCNEVLLFRHQF